MDTYNESLKFANEFCEKFDIEMNNAQKARFVDALIAFREASQQSFALDGVPPCACKKFIPLEDNPEFCAVCKKPRRK